MCVFCDRDVDKKSWAMLLGPVVDGKRVALSICSNCFNELCKKLRGQND